MKLKTIEFETAKLAKEVGFDIEVPEIYSRTDSTKTTVPSNQIGDLFGNRFLAPEQALLQKWLREVHEIVVTVNLLKNRWNVSVVNGIKIATHAYASPVYDTYEEALEDGLYQGLKMIKDNDKIH